MQRTTCGPNFVSVGLVFAWESAAKFEFSSAKLRFRAAQYVAASSCQFQPHSCITHCTAEDTVSLHGRTQCHDTVCGIWLLVPFSQDVSARSADYVCFISWDHQIVL